jgi:L-alanine-DL-glutamate epimerase-like enolase superfamily enzyme
MAITSIEATYLEIPLPADFHPSWVPGLTQQYNRCLFVEVHDDSGHTGIGAGTVFEKGQAEFGKFVAVDTIGRFLIGADPFAIENHAKLITRFAFMIGGRPWPLECALWDLQAKIAGVPLYKLLGGSRDRIPLYCSFGESLQFKDIAARKEAVDARQEEGFSAFKLRSRSASYRDDVRLMEAIRSHVGDEVELMIDCNQGWNLSPLGAEWSHQDTREFCRAAGALGFRWVEEPRHRFDWDGLARLCREVASTSFSPTPVWPGASSWRGRSQRCASRGPRDSAPTPGPTASASSPTSISPAASPTATFSSIPTKSRGGCPRRETPCSSNRRVPGTASSRLRQGRGSAVNSTAT